MSTDQYKSPPTPEEGRAGTGIRRKEVITLHTPVSSSFILVSMYYFGSEKKELLRSERLRQNRPLKEEACQGEPAGAGMGWERLEEAAACPE